MSTTTEPLNEFPAPAANPPTRRIFPDSAIDLKFPRWRRESAEHAFATLPVTAARPDAKVFKGLNV